MHYLCGESGALVLDLQKGETLHREEISREIAEIMMTAGKRKDLMTCVFSDGICCVKRAHMLHMDQYQMGQYQKMYEKISENHSIEGEEAKQTAKLIGMAAIKYGDLSNQASKDYVFDVDRFTSFEGNTGPYILYTIVRIKSILNKYQSQGNSLDGLKVQEAYADCEKALMLEAAKYNDVMANAFQDLAPHKICAYIYDLANAFNRFYHETKILAEEDAGKQKSYIALLKVTKDVLEACIDVLGFEAPERM